MRMLISQQVINLTLKALAGHDGSATHCCLASRRGPYSSIGHLSGALFALLVGATTSSLVFQAFATDRWLSDLVQNSPLSPQLTALCALLFVALCASVLDAFEIIFVVIPTVAPALIAKLGDAQQAAVLLLLVLQTSFLIPPMGYAVVVVTPRTGLSTAPTLAIVKSL